MKIVLSPGESLDIEYEGTDGSVEVTFADDATEVKVNGEPVHRDPFTWIAPLSEPGDGET